MKAFATLGLGVNGRVFITDDDNIELSNLSRQFLFRRQHVGKPKSSCAAEAAVAMNPELKKCLKDFQIRVEPKTETTFDDASGES
jgi:ubiquitin-activating enzyme E1